MLWENCTSSCQAIRLTGPFPLNPPGPPVCCQHPTTWTTCYPHPWRKNRRLTANLPLLSLNFNNQKAKRKGNWCNAAGTNKRTPKSKQMIPKSTSCLAEQLKGYRNLVQISRCCWWKKSCSGDAWMNHNLPKTKKINSIWIICFSVFFHQERFLRFMKNILGHPEVSLPFYPRKKWQPKSLVISRWGSKVP